MNIKQRLSPSTLIATAAVVLAASGTAVAAGEIITNSDQVADRAITGLDIKQQDISNFNLRDPQLKLRVNANGTNNGIGDATVKRAAGNPTGVYDITFSSRVLNADTGTTDTVLSENCAITATPRSTSGPGIPQLLVSKPQFASDNTVRVTAVRQEVAGDGKLSAFVTDTAFDITASC
jgi:hypothetical protein